MDNETLKAAWMCNDIKVENFLTHSSGRYGCDAYFGKDSFNRPMFCMLGVEHTQNGTFKQYVKFNMQTAAFSELSEDDIGYLYHTRPRFEILTQCNNAQGIQKIFLSDREMKTTVEIAENSYHDISDALDKFEIFQQDLVVARKTGLDPSGLLSSTLQIYALNPWSLLRRVKVCSAGDSIFINPQGTTLVLMHRIEDLLYFNVVMLCLTGHKKLTPSLNGKDAFFYFR